MWLATVLVLGAAPVAGSSFQWTFDDTTSGSATAIIDGRRQTQPMSSSTLGKVSLKVKVLEVGERGPTKLDVKVLSGRLALVGRRWLVESDYGDARLVLPPGTKLTEVQKGYQELYPADFAALRALLSSLFKEDPVVAATTGVPPCAAETLTKVAAATGDAIRAAFRGARTGATVEDASASCTGKGASYRVSVKLKIPWGSDSAVLPWTGTASVAPGAWRAALDFSASTTFAPKDSRVSLKGKVKAVLKSRFAKP